MPELSFEDFETSLDYDSDAEHLLASTLVSEMVSEEASIQLADVAEPSGLATQTSMFKALIKEPPSIGASMDTDTALGNPLVQQAATVAPIGQVAQTSLGKASARYFAEDFRVATAEGDSVKLSWDSP